MSKREGNIGGVNSQDGRDAVLERYEGWAGDYETDLASVNYRLPALMAKLFRKHVHEHNADILDAGCGTGLSGEALKNEGYSQIVGVDLSPAMLQIAREKGIYARVVIGDVTSLPFSEGEFGHTIAVGTVGVAPAGCLAELARVTRIGGIIMFSNRRGEHFAEGAGFLEQQEALEKNNAWALVERIDDLVADDKPGSDPFVIYVYRRRER